MIADLQADGVLSRDHAEELDEALRSPCTIRAAIGIIMTSRHVREDQAFLILRKVSQDSNRKVRDIAADPVHSAALIELRSPEKG